MVAVPGPLSLSNIVLDKRGAGTATVTRHISRWRRREIQKWKIAFRKPRFVDLQDQTFVFLLCIRHKKINLRKKISLSITRCRTDRFRNSFIVGASNSFNSKQLKILDIIIILCFVIFLSMMNRCNSVLFTPKMVFINKQQQIKTNKKQSLSNPHTSR